MASSDRQKEYRKTQAYKDYMERTKESRKLYMQEYRKKNPNLQSDYRKNNPDKIKKHKQNYFKRRKHIAYKYANERWKTDFDYRLRTYLRKRIRAAIKQNFKSGKSIELLGCDIASFKNYIESQFKNGMSWDNYGTHGWHIDHIKPIASFDLSNMDEQKKCFHYTNMQPLWAFDNHSKGAKL